MSKPIGQQQMNQIMQLLDELGINREAVRVALRPEGDGSIEPLPGDQARLVLPANRPLEAWIPELRQALASMDLPAAE